MLFIIRSFGVMFISFANHFQQARLVSDAEIQVFLHVGGSRIRRALRFLRDEGVTFCDCLLHSCDLIVAHLFSPVSFADASTIPHINAKLQEIYKEKPALGGFAVTRMA